MCIIISYILRDDNLFQPFTSRFYMSRTLFLRTSIVIKRKSKLESLQTIAWEFKSFDWDHNLFKKKILLFILET